MVNWFLFSSNERIFLIILMAEESTNKNSFMGLEVVSIPPAVKGAKWIAALLMEALQPQRIGNQ